MPIVASAIRYTSARETSASLLLKGCTIEKKSNRVDLTFAGGGHTGWGYKVNRFTFTLPEDLARQIAKVMLSEVAGLWDKWSLDFPEETAA